MRTILAAGLCSAANTEVFCASRRGDLRLKAACASEGCRSRSRTAASGANLQVVSDSGATDGLENGKGNLIVGYNEISPGLDGEPTGGSHNLILGIGHGYSSFGGLVAGSHDTNQRPVCGHGGLRRTANGQDDWKGGGRPGPLESTIEEHP